MRPGQVCPGKRRRSRAATGQHGPASMRPGQVCPGKQMKIEGIAAAYRASMRPGQVCPGKLAAQSLNTAKG